MSKLNQVFSVLAATLMVFGLAANVQAELLFSDNFSGADNTADYGLNDNLSSRLGGTVGTALATSGTAWGRATYTNAIAVQANNSNAADKMWIYRETGGSSKSDLHTQTAIIQHDFNDDVAKITADGGFSFRFEADHETVSDTTSMGYGGAFFYVGGASATGNPYTYNSYSHWTGPYDTEQDFCVMLKDNGMAQIAKPTSSTPAWISTQYDPALYASGMPGGAQEYTFEVRVATNDFASGTAASAELWVIGKAGDTSWIPYQVDLNPADAGGVLGAGSLTFDWNWDDNGMNYIAFGQSSSLTDQGSTIDNIQIVTGPNGVVPEPSTLALLAAGLFGLLAYAWRSCR